MELGAVALPPHPTMLASDESMRSNLTAVASRAPNSTRSKLTAEERTYLLANNGCLYCRKLGHWAGGCAEKKRNANRPILGNGSS